jgi:hypothetical protein
VESAGVFVASPIQAPAPIVPAAERAPAPIEPESAVMDHDKGVLRLLEAGHFRGVADVRLRINFFDELSARAADRAAATLGAQSHLLVTSVESKLDEVIAPLADNAALQAKLETEFTQFREAVESTIDQQSAGAAIDKDSLIAALQTDFDALVSQLREVFAPAAEVPVDPSLPDPGQDLSAPLAVLESLTAGVEPVVEPPVPTEPAPSTDETAPSLESAITDLSDAFASALAELLASLDGALQLPALSPPHGDGKAYQKFLTVYNNMLGSPAVNQLA